MRAWRAAAAPVPCQGVAALLWQSRCKFRDRQGESMHLRGYERADARGLHALDVLCFEEPFRFSKAAMKRFAEAPNALVLLAVNKEEGSSREALLGFCIVHLEPLGQGVAGYLVTLDVAPATRGKGVATRLMAAMESAAGNAGATTMLLHVFRENVAAISLYTRLGYRYTGVAADFYGAGLHALQYQRVLPREGTPGEAATEAAGP